MIRWLSIAVGVYLAGALVVALFSFFRGRRWEFRDHKPRFWFFRKLGRLERAMLLIVGRRGEGKTLVATDIALRRMRAGERVYANYEITDYQAGLRAGRVYSLADLCELSDCTVIVDEANLWCDSRSFAKIPLEVRSRWAQSRHFGLSLVFTAQHEDRVDKILRELVDWVVICQKPRWLPKRAPLVTLHYTWLEEVEQVRRGVLSKAEQHVISPAVYAAYDTHEIVDSQMLERLSEAVADMRAGKDSQERVGSIREPQVWREGRWQDIPRTDPLAGVLATPSPSPAEVS